MRKTPVKVSAMEAMAWGWPGWKTNQAKVSTIRPQSTAASGARSWGVSSMKKLITGRATPTGMARKVAGL